MSEIHAALDRHRRERTSPGLWPSAMVRKCARACRQAVAFMRAHRPSRRIAVVVTCVAVLGLAGVAMAYQVMPHRFSRLDLPPFDPRKAAALSPQLRAQWEQELFSELQQWNMGSRRYPTVADIARREQRWQFMADNGFELAHITLRVLKPVGGLIYDLEEPMLRLEELARQGDAGAMCLMAPLVGNAAQKIDPDLFAQTYKHWLEKGAFLGHPECMLALGGRLLLGVDGYPKSVERGLALDLAGRRAGYLHDVGALILHFKAKGLADPADVRRTHCWFQMRERTWFRDFSQDYLDELEKQAREKGDPQLLTLQAELKDKRFELDDCIHLTEGGR